jgi:hypothetical protein
MTFYIDVETSGKCFISSIKRLCVRYGYMFIPDNKKYYCVDTIAKSCIGTAQTPNNAHIVSEATSFGVIQNLFGNRHKIH